jgi:hypothetical protein
MEQISIIGYPATVTRASGVKMSVSFNRKPAPFIIKKIFFAWMFAAYVVFAVSANDFRRILLFVDLAKAIYQMIACQNGMSSSAY